MNSSLLRTQINLSWIGSVAAIALGFGGFAVPQVASAASPDLISSVCRSAMGLEPGQSQYQACLQSLADTARAMGKAQTLDQARSDCRARGLQNGPDLAECELRDSWTRREPTLASAASQRPEPGSYFGETNTDHFRREQLSCARLGLNPASAAFDACVGDLRSALFAADNPSQ
jgi:hypothetical protein